MRMMAQTKKSGPSTRGVDLACGNRRLSDSAPIPYTMENA
jgi:hypothetical protein